MSKIRNFFKPYERVLNTAKKPDKEEFMETIKLTGAGMIIIGLMGLIINIIFAILGL